MAGRVLRHARKLTRVTAAVGLYLLITTAPDATAGDTPTCATDGNLHEAGAGCVKSPLQALAYVAQRSNHAFRVELACITENALCPEAPTCDGGYVYDIWEDGVQLAWEACLSVDQATTINHLAPGWAIRAFKHLTWPASQLIIQPPHGKTLVNLDTNFYTPHPHPTTQTVTLLGQTITIQATPTRYTWHFDDPTTSTGDPTGDPTGDLTTNTPGAPYPDLEITHRYLHPGHLTPRLDTTYTGRYRVDHGPWQTIPDTLTVPGTPVPLQVLTATPHLVGY